jgi:hypothetical protein
MIKQLLFILTCLIFAVSEAQQNYCDFEGSKAANFAVHTGKIDTGYVNTFPGNNVNNSTNCAKYIRDANLFDNFQLHPYTKLVDVSSYAKNELETPQISLKMYTSATPGTIINLQLGKRSDLNYPSGVHSEYTATTEVKNAWHLVNFHFVKIPSGSQCAPTDVDRLVFLFHPNSSARDTLYFDDPTGPPLIQAIGIAPIGGVSSFRLAQNQPNPAKGSTSINFVLRDPGHVSLAIFDILGNKIQLLVDQTMTAGSHTVTVNTEDLSSGIYFYVLKKDGISKSMKMTVER